MSTNENQIVVYQTVRTVKCCQCANVANYQYHFPMKDVA